jgi:hypothetical protein
MGTQPTSVSITSHIALFTSNTVFQDIIVFSEVKIIYLQFDLDESFTNEVAFYYLPCSKAGSTVTYSVTAIKGGDTTAIEFTVSSSPKMIVKSYLLGAAFIDGDIRLSQPMNITIASNFGYLFLYSNIVTLYLYKCNDENFAHCDYNATT